MDNVKTLSELFDVTIQNVFKVPIDKVFQDGTVASYSYRDPKGNVAEKVETKIGDSVTDTYYINGTLVKDLPEFVKAELQFTGEEELKKAVTPLKTLPGPLVTGTELPQLNIYITDKQELYIEALLAGVPVENVQLSYTNEYLKISGNYTPENSKSLAAITKSINQDFSNFEKSIYIDPSKFNIKGISYYIENGILCITIPKSKSVEASIIFPLKKPKATKRKLVEAENTEKENS